MEPRLKSSKKWTSIPQEYLEQIQEALRQAFSEQAQKGQFIAEGQIYAQEILIRLGYLEAGRLKQANFEVSLEYDQAKDNALKVINTGIDCAASMAQQYFEDGEDVDFPRQWKKFEVNKREVYVCHSTVNSQLEKQADQLLGLDDQGELVKDDNQDEADRELAKDMLGLNEDDDKKAH